MDRFSIVKSFVLVCLTLALFPVFPAAGETKPRYISGRILSAAPDGASVVISRGSEDNVVEGTEVIIRENRGEDEAHVEWDFYICKGTVEEIYEDSSLVVVTDSKAPVVPGDYVDVVAEIPVALAEIDLGVIALFDVGIAYYESGMPIYTLGELVENHSPKKIDDIESRFIEEIRLHGPTVESWWPDQKIRGGYFDGMSWTEAYRSTTEEHVETFIEYIRYFPGSYHNRDWNLIYLYGVWVFNETKSAEPEKNRLRADSFVSRGDELVLEGAYNEALSQYKKALEAMPEHPSATERFEMVGILIKNKKIVEQDPGDVDAQFWLGRAYYRLGRYGDALGHLKKARDLGYNYRTVNMNIAYTYSYSGNYTESRKVFEKLHERFPEDEDIRHWLEWVTAREMQEVHGATAESYITTGRLRYREKDYDLAIEEYNKALELDPESQYVWRLIYAASKRSRAHQNQIWAREYWKNGQFETAEYFWENALEICKEIDDEKAQLEILLEMADAMYGSLFYQNAIQTYSRVLDIDPGHYDSIISISNSYESMDQDREAIAWARKGIELEPDNSWGYNVLGYIFLKTGRFEEAADSFSKAVELSLHYNQALYNLGLTYIRMGRYAEAEKQFGAALDVNQDYSLAREKLAALLIISETEPLLRENPGDYENRLRYARALRTLQEYEKSNSELARILRDEPENVVALSYMGYNHSALGNYEKARRYVEKAYRIEPKQNLEAWLFDLEGDIRLKRNPDDPEGYTNLGMADLYWEYYGEALSEFEQAQRLGADPDQIFRLMEMARTGREAKRLYELMYEYLRMGNQDKALESARTAVSLYREIGLRKGSFYATFALGQCLANMFKHQEARRAFDKAKEIAVEQANRVMLAHYHSEIGNYYSNIGDYEKALEHKMEAMDIYHRNNMPGSEAKNTLTWIGYLYSVLGELDRMYDFYHQALEYHEKMRDYKSLASALLDIGWVYFEDGEISQALDHFLQSLEIAREHDMEWIELGAYHGIADLYEEIGAIDKALTYYHHYFDLATALGSKSDRATALTNMGVLYYEDLKDYSKARESYEEALRIARLIGYTLVEGVATSGIGAVLAKEGEYDKALAYGYKGLELVQSVNVIDNELGVLLDIGETYHAMGEYEKALEKNMEALQRAETTISGTFKWMCAVAVAKDYEAMGKIDDAITYYKKAVDLLSYVKKRIADEEMRRIYSEKDRQLEVYQRLIDLLIEQGRLEEAFHYVEESKSKIISNTFGDVMTTTTDDEELNKTIEGVDIAEKKKHALENQIQKEMAKPKEQQDQEKIDRLFETLARTEREFNQLMLTLQFQNRQMYAALAIKPVTLVKLHDQIPEDTVLLQYFISQEKLYIFCVGHEYFYAKSVDIREEKLNSLVRKFMKRCHRPNVRQQLFDQVAVELYGYLIEPVENEIEPYQNLVIVPAGVLYYLPFQALVRDSGTESEYLIEWKSISYTLSATILNILELKQRQVSSLVAFGNPDGSLPAASKEVRKLKEEIFRDRARVWIQEQATKDNLYRYAREYDVLHIATHGVITYNAPDSYLLFAGDDEEQQRLTLLDIAGFTDLKENTDLVFLSACQTAVEEAEEYGTELISLASAFATAGPPTLIATLWKVSDESTLELVLHFYRELVTGKKDATRALREAQIKLIESEKYSSPFFWAPFIIIGNWR